MAVAVDVVHAEKFCAMKNLFTWILIFIYFAIAYLAVIGKKFMLKIMYILCFMWTCTLCCKSSVCGVIYYFCFKFDINIQYFSILASKLPFEGDNISTIAAKEVF